MTLLKIYNGGYDAHAQVLNAFNFFSVKIQLIL